MLFLTYIEVTKKLKNKKADVTLARERAKLQFERENLVAQMKYVAKFTESLTAGTVNQFTSRYDNIS